jgi:hypothetical protein
MSVHGSHGYEISIDSIGHGKVRLSATRGDFLSLLLGSGSIVSASYVVPGRVTRHRLHANLGKLGLISVRFHRHGRPIHGHTPSFLRCRGRAPIGEHGRFEGTIRFRGEQGFTRVALHGARGSVVRRFKRSCRPRHHSGRAAPARSARRPGPKSIHATVLAAAQTRHGRLTALETIGLEAPPKKKGGEIESLTLVAAARLERRSRIQISRSAMLIGDQGSLLASRPGVVPVTATVILPGPFAGTGSYLEQAGHASSWTGPLRVRLPGADRVPLAGKTFTASFCREETPKKAVRCLSAIKEASGSAAPASVALGRRLLAARG